MTLARCSYVWRSSVVAFGVLCFISGIYLYLNWIDMFTRIRGKEMALTPTSKSFPDWKVSPLPLYFDVYLFNWTNPQDFYVGSKIKPHFKQLGPYRFREIPDKVDIEWHDHNYTVSFRKKGTFFFDAAGSRGSLTDRITTVNVVAHAAALYIKDKDNGSKLGMQFALKFFHQKLSVTKTAEEWMFKGYENALVSIGTFFSKFSDSIQMPYDRVGWLYMRNDSSNFDGHLNMFTGVDDINKMGQVHTWNDKTHTGAFEGECGAVRGSMGEFFPQNLRTNDSISIFLPNLCRAVPLDYSETVEVHGIKAYKFSGGARSVDNGTLYPETKCFCVNGKCEKAGVINVAPCKYNSSVYMSYPHFYKADPSYLEAIEGLHPVKELHEFFMTLEPNSGVVMDVGGGFQVNYLLEPVQGLRQYENIPRTFMPIMWCEERVRVTPEIAKSIALVPLFVLLGQVFTGILLASGMILLCWYPARFVTQLRRDPKTKKLLLHPLSNVVSPLSTNTILTTHLRPIEDAPLLAIKNSVVIRPNGTVTEGLLGNTLCSTQEVITRC